MSNTEKTPVFWLGLVVFGYAIVQFVSAIWLISYALLIYPTLLHATSPSSIPSTVTSSLLLGLTSPSLATLIISGIVFAVIGLYIMMVGGRKRPSTESSLQTQF